MISIVRRWASLLVLLAMPGLCYASINGQIPLIKGERRPNIVFILTDDQDLHMDSPSYMPFLQKHLVDQGTSFSSHYCTVALCCPSRVSIWTGKAAHNKNVTDVNPPHGGYPKFISQGLNEAYLPLWLQEAGYNTYYVGKLFNAQTVDNYNKPPAAGWTGSEFLLDPYTYEYLNATFTRDGGPPVSYEGQYSTDLIAEKSFSFLDDALTDGEKKPFFLSVAPIAPHSNVQFGPNIIDGNFSEDTNVQSPPIPAKRHQHLFEDVAAPRTEHFNPDDPHGVSWIGRLPKQNQTNLDFNDHFYRSRLRALQAVDEMVDELLLRLEQAGILEETYVFYSTDNGYHIGQHRLQPGKQCAFEEDINVPLIVRGPGFGKGKTANIVSTHTDLAPTFLKLAGGQSREDFDGAAMTLFAHEPSRKTEHVNIEMWGIIMSEGEHGAVLYPNHTYKALRVIGEEYSYLYTVWCSGEHELYDLKGDPFEMNNLCQPNLYWAMEPNSMLHCTDEDPNFSCWSGETDRLVQRLDALLMVLKSCKGEICRDPWRALHPKGIVASLHDALDTEFDDFYRVSQQKVSFDKCEMGYIVESEGPQSVKPYLGGIGG